MNTLIPRQRTQIAPGAVHVPDWLSLEQQRELVAQCRDWANGPVPIRHTRLPGGGVMSVQTVCVGWHWIVGEEDLSGVTLLVEPVTAIGIVACLASMTGTVIGAGRRRRRQTSR